MELEKIIPVAARSLTANKVRSSLTILGIVIGVVAIMLIVSLGDGAEDFISGEIASLGADIIWVEPGREPKGPSDFISTALSNTLKDADVEALRNPANAPYVTEVVPAVQVVGTASRGSETYRPLMLGFSAEFMGKVFDIYPEHGQYFGDDAIRGKERVAVIGSRVKDELFGIADAVGDNFKINGKSFRVVGVLPDEGQIFFLDVGELVIVPYSTARTYLTGTDHYNEIWIRVNDVRNIAAAVEDVKATLRTRHDITDPSKDDFYVLTQDNLLDQISSIVTTLTYSIAAIVAIALIVAGVGIMNIMLVAVTERTQEIGLRKAVGATERDIRSQFLVEAILLSAAGGAIGIVLGALLAFAASLGIGYALDTVWAFTFPAGAALLGIFASATVGIIFGYYPARQAARKDPIEALRYE